MQVTSEVWAFAKNRLNKSYNSKLYKAPPKVEVSAEDRIYANQGGEVTTAAPGGIAGTGITSLVQVSSHKQNKDAPGPPGHMGRICIEVDVWFARKEVS